MYPLCLFFRMIESNIEFFNFLHKIILTLMEWLKILFSFLINKLFFRLIVYLKELFK